MPTFREMIQQLDKERTTQFQSLAERNDEDLTPSEKHQKSMAPIAHNTVFLMSFGEPFFEDTYPALQRLAQDKKHPTIHFGIGGTRNLSIAGAAKADAVILADFNATHLKTMESLRDVALTLDKEKGSGNFGPEDFVKAFSAYKPVQGLLDKVPENPELHSTIPTDLSDELRVPESWLFKDQTDGRFQHIMKLFKEDKIATLPMNVLDTDGFKDLADVLHNARQEIPELEGAKISSVFLANMLYFLSRPTAYITNESMPKMSGKRALDNISIIAPDNPYVVFAKKNVAEMQENPDSPFFDRNLINGPDHATVSRVKDEGERELLQQVTLGGHLDVLHTLPELWEARNERYQNNPAYDKGLATRDTKPVHGAFTQKAAIRDGGYRTL